MKYTVTGFVQAVVIKHFRQLFVMVAAFKAIGKINPPDALQNNDVKIIFVKMNL